LHAEGGAEGFDEEGLGEAGHTFEQHVAVGEEGDQQPLHGVVLADHGLADFIAKFLGPNGAGKHGGKRGVKLSGSAPRRERKFCTGFDWRVPELFPSGQTSRPWPTIYPILTRT